VMKVRSFCAWWRFHMRMQTRSEACTNKHTNTPWTFWQVHETYRKRIENWQKIAPVVVTHPVQIREWACLCQHMKKAPYHQNQLTGHECTHTYTSTQTNMAP
jgi:hypothetical protein